jgi:hypothetical protein
LVSARSRLSTRWVLHTLSRAICWLKPRPALLIQSCMSSLNLQCSMTHLLQLCYTRGSVIPLCLTITCADEQVLDLLSASNAPAVKLLRNKHYNSRVKGKQRVDALHKPEFRIVQGAIWWISRNQSASGVRHLMGEIHIAPRLTPALQTPEFRLFVSFCYYVTQLLTDPCIFSTLLACLHRTCRHLFSPESPHEKPAADAGPFLLEKSKSPRSTHRMACVQSRSRRPHTTRPSSGQFQPHYLRRREIRLTPTRNQLYVRQCESSGGNDCV